MAGAVTSNSEIVSENNSGRSLADQAVLMLKARAKRKAQRGYKATFEEALNSKHQTFDDGILAPMLAQRLEKSRHKNIRPSRLSASKQKDTVQKNLHKQAKAMNSRLEQLKEVQNVQRINPIKFPAHPSVEIHNPYPLRAEGITVTYDQKIILNDLSFQVPLGKKIAVTGQNGAGKSTLFNYLLTEQAGVIWSPNVQIETYRQMDYQFFESTPLLDELMNDTDWPEKTVRALLNNLGFAQLDVGKPLNELSGGEATRVAIAKLFTKPANFLLLDEPTNFIDLRTIEALELFLKAYQGTVLFTSHDAHFIENVADEVWTLQAGKLQI